MHAIVVVVVAIKKQKVPFQYIHEPNCVVIIFHIIIIFGCIGITLFFSITCIFDQNHVRYCWILCIVESQHHVDFGIFTG